MFKSLSLHFYNMTKYTTIIRNHQYTQYNEKRKKEEIKKKYNSLMYSFKLTLFLILNFRFYNKYYFQIYLQEFQNSNNIRI